MIFDTMKLGYDGNIILGEAPLTVTRVTWGKAPPFGDDLSLTYLFASTSEKVTCI